MNDGRVTAGGDIHGCSAALVALTESIQLAPIDSLVILGNAA